MYFRRKTSAGRAYLQIFASRREGDQVRQQVIATLGRCDELQASGSDCCDRGQRRLCPWRVTDQIFGFSGQLRRLFLLSDPHTCYSGSRSLDFRVSALSC
jgi:hypothetical protein